MRLTKKKYGLIWEEHEEESCHKELETENTCILRHIKSKEIKNKDENEYNFILERRRIYIVYIY